MKVIPLFDLNYDSRETEAVQRVMDRRWISGGPELQAFEKEFGEFLGVPATCAVSSCTSALHLALMLCDVGPGDEVLVPSLTFAATANVVLQHGAQPVFVDITSHDDWTFSVEDARSKISERTKVLLPVHYGGFLANMNEIRRLADEFDCLIVEDAAHSPFASRRGATVGSEGDIACFSFYSNKNISAGEGGLLAANNTTLIDRARLLRSHGISRSAYERASGDSTYEIMEPGYNYRMNDLSAALCRVQLDKFEADRMIRQDLFNEYRSGFVESGRVFIPFSDYQGDSSFHILPVYVPGVKRAKLAPELLKKGIQTSYHYPSLHRFGCYQTHASKLSLLEEIEEHILTLPLHAGLSQEQVRYICGSLLDLC
jgi:dTDP-4-amino-4,6-dideoxygalactose transaminase